VSSGTFVVDLSRIAPLRARAPRYIKYAPPTYFRTVKASADRASTNATPSADTVPQIRHPRPMPSDAKKAWRLPLPRVCRITSAMSAPGVIVRSPATTRKASSCAAGGKRCVMSEPEEITGLHKQLARDARSIIHCRRVADIDGASLVEEQGSQDHSRRRPKTLSLNLNLNDPGRPRQTCPVEELRETRPNELPHRATRAA